MAADLLVSFCNAGSDTEFGLGCVDTRTNRFDMVDLRAIRQTLPYSGITGLCHFGSRIVIGLQGMPRLCGALAFLDQDLQVLEVVKLARARDVHSIVARGDTLIIVSTGTDEVISYTPADGKEHVIYAASQSGIDTVHLNGACIHQGRLLVSMFGPQRPRGVRCGRVVDCDSGEIWLDGLRQPHSVTSAGDFVLVLESATGHLVKFDRQRVLDPWVAYTGYARGLCWVDDRLFVGRSRRRLAFRGDAWSAGSLVSLETDDGMEHMQTALLVRDPNGENSALRLTYSANEIYDLLPLRRAPAPALLPAAWVRAYACLNAKKTAEVETILQSEPLAERLPGRLLAEARLALQDGAGAQRALAQISSPADQDFTLLRLASKAHALQSEFAAAAATARQAYALAPNDDEVAALLPKRLVEAGQPAAAIAVLHEVTGAIPSDRHWLALSRLLMLAQSDDLALQAAANAMECAPLNALTLLQYARVLKKLNRPAEQLDALELAVEVEPSSQRAQSELTALLSRMGELDRALIAATRALRLAPTDQRLQQRRQALLDRRDQKNVRAQQGRQAMTNKDASP